MAAPSEDLLAPTLPAWTVATPAPVSDVLPDLDPADLVLVVGRSATPTSRGSPPGSTSVGLPGADWSPPTSRRRPR